MVGAYIFVLSVSLMRGMASRPNIVFIMADDLGWNDVSWHNQRMHSPNLEYLAHNHAALLMRAYVNRLCSITRSAFLAGHYSFHMGTQENTFHWMEPSGVPEGYKFFPELLQQSGYKTYLVGKWHLGYCKEEFLPNNRGFDRFRGYYMAKEGYFNHSYSFDGYSGLDFWEDTNPRFGLDGSYSTEIYTEDVKEFLHKHNRSHPFFLYLAYQAVHFPNQVPDRYLAPCTQTNQDRRLYCGMVNAMDYSIGQVIDTLKELGYYDNTVIFFSTDNGGETGHGGNNYPLRGNKETLWEGGTRAISFAHSPKYITNPVLRHQSFSVVDWFATILNAAGLPYDNYGDGINQWTMISDGSQPGNRTSFVYNIFPKGSAIRRGKFKMILGNAGNPSGWIPPPNEGIETDTKTPHPPSSGLFLFDVENDPEEKHNIVTEVEIGLVASMIREIAKFMDQMKPSVHRGIDKRGDPALFNATFSCCWC